MSRFSIGAAFAVIAAIPADPSLAQVTYKGDDVLRLKCATMLTLTSYLDGKDSSFSAATRLKARSAAAVLLAQLPGQPIEKARAMQAMADRLIARNSPAALSAEFERALPACERFF